MRKFALILASLAALGSIAVASAEVAPEDVPQALEQLLFAEGEEAAGRIESQFLGYCADESKQEPGLCVTVVAIEDGWAKVIRGQKFGETGAAFAYELVDGAWVNRGEIDESAPFPSKSNEAPGAPVVGTGLQTTHDDHFPLIAGASLLVAAALGFALVRRSA